MSISINNLFRQFRVQLPILTTLPEVVPAGAEFYYQGTKWRGLGADETGLPEGTPWPVKGYKEWLGVFAFDGTNEPVAVNVFLNEVGKTLSMQYVAGFSFSLFFDGEPFSEAMSIITHTPSIDANGGQCGIAQLNAEDSTGIRTIKYADGINGESSIETSGILFSIRIYPPQP
jgi:hypothetical protein